MPPKVRINRESIIEAAVDIVREHGAAALNARSLATALFCSTQPIFSNFASMEELKNEVLKRARTISDDYAKEYAKRGGFPRYKSTGLAYIAFAREEKELFKLLYMRDRSREEQLRDAYESSEIITTVSESTELSGEDARLFHLEMWALVHGIATMLVTSHQEIEEQTISKMLTDVYIGLIEKHKTLHGGVFNEQEKDNRN